MADRRQFANITGRVAAAAPAPAPTAPAPQAATRPVVTSGFGTLGSWIGSLVPKYAQPTTIQQTSMISSIFYGSVIMFVLFLILIAINFTIYPVFSFSPNDNGLIPIPTVSDQQIAFTKGPAASDLSANFVNIPSCSYSLGMDVYLSGDFMASNIPRVLLYRSTAARGVSLISTDTSGNLPTRFPDTNLLIWLDPIKNDLYASVRTSSDGTAATSKLTTTPPIENVPIKKVFRLTVIFTQQFIELYINGNLEKSMALSNPIAAPPAANLFPVASPNVPNVMISNLAFWPRVLTSREARAYGSPISNENFFSKTASK